MRGKNNFGKVLSEISGQYFYQDFQPHDRIFPTVFFPEKFHLVIGWKFWPNISSRRISLLPYQSLDRRERIFFFTLFYPCLGQNFPGQNFSKLYSPGQNFSLPHMDFHSLHKTKLCFFSWLDFKEDPYSATFWSF